MPVIVIDNGSGSIKGGISGAGAPECEIQSFVGRPLKGTAQIHPDDIKNHKGKRKYVKPCSIF
jgi:actin-related protein